MLCPVYFVDMTKAVHTVLTMQNSEFDRFSVGLESSPVTYCLKELRAIIGFADSFRLSLSIDFDSGGK